MTQSTSAASNAKRSRTWLGTKALAKASWGLLNPKIWGLSLLPFLLASVMWAAIAFVAWDPLSAMLRDLLAYVNLPVWLTHWFPAWLQTLAESSRAVWIPFAVLLVVVPAVLITALALTGMLGVGVVARGVAPQYGLAPLGKGMLHQGFSLLAGVWHSTWVLAMLGLAWLITMPLWLLPGLVIVVPLLLMAWANARLFARDVLVDFATQAECEQLREQHRGALWVLGLIAALPAFIPTALWLSGAMVMVFLPVLAAIAVWLYVMIVLASALMFSHYLLAALAHLRADVLAAQLVVQAQKDALDAEKDQQAIELEMREVSPHIALGA